MTIQVVREDLEGTQVQRLVVVEPGDGHHYAGECVGYFCPECEQADETLDQIWHEPDCSHAGKHGRSHYDYLEPDVEERPTPEFREGHPITVIKYGETEGRGGLHAGEVIGFSCRCGNADEDLFELVHERRVISRGATGKRTANRMYRETRASEL